MLKVDLHLHSAEDPLDQIDHPVTDLIDRAAGLGFDALAITLHDRQFADARVAAHARARGITLVPGMERTILGRHVLLLNFPAAAAEAVQTFDDLRRLKARANGLVIAPHPWFPDKSCLRRLLDHHPDLFDAIEWSYFWTRGINFNRRAARWADAHGKPVVGNSDLHDLRQLGRTYSRIDADRDPDAICDAIRNGRVQVVTEPVPALELIDVFGRMVLRGTKPNQQRDPSKPPCEICATPSVRFASSRSSRSSLF